jgi:hypothetical protein
MSGTTQTLENKKALKDLQDPYVNIMRQKIGEFMLIRGDLERRGTISGVGLDNMIDKTVVVYQNKTNKEIAEFTIKNKSNNSTGDWADDLQISPLSTLLFNNGFPCQIIVKTLTKPESISDNQLLEAGVLGDVVYKMPVVYAGAKGEPVDTGTQDHYTFIIPTDMKDKINIPENLQNLLTDDMEETSVTDGMVKYQTEGDGHCFYRAVANWCIIYGITTDHLKNMTYNVPFEFSEEHFKRNLKVPNQTQQIPIPKPIEFPTNLEFIKKDALIIAQNMKNKITQEDFNPTFGDLQTIDETHTEYKNYDGLKKDNGTHCNKYKGNKYKGNKE